VSVTRLRRRSLRPSSLPLAASIPPGFPGRAGLLVDPPKAKPESPAPAGRRRGAAPQPPAPGAPCRFVRVIWVPHASSHRIVDRAGPGSTWPRAIMSTTLLGRDCQSGTRYQIEFGALALTRARCPADSAARSDSKAIGQFSIVLECNVGRGASPTAMRTLPQRPLPRPAKRHPSAPCASVWLDSALAYNRYGGSFGDRRSRLRILRKSPCRRP
jgi:hypothetical protein